jgi:hypothetical protein
VIELNRPVPSDKWHKAGLLELDESTGEAVVAFSSDPQLGAFLERLAKHREAEPSSAGTLFAADLFDAVERIRRYGPVDRVAPRLVDVLAQGSEDPLLIDVELWHPGDDVPMAEQWQLDVERATRDSGGGVVDRYVDHARGIVLLRVRIGLEAVAGLSDVDEIATLDLVPQAPPVLVSALESTVDDLPPRTPPKEDAPLVALIDSGVNASNPLIDQALYSATTLLPGLTDGADDHGHGTAVAGVLLHGPTEDFLVSGVLPRPFGRLLSVRVLDQSNGFPQGVLFERAVADAVRYAAGLGAQVINISIGDPAMPQRRRRATPVASVLDSLARELDVVLVVPTGNTRPADYTSNDAGGANTYASKSLQPPASALIDPAPSALALTVGGTGQSAGLPKVGEIILGGDDEPSAITRCGPGVARGIKPDLVSPSGTMAWSPTLGFVDRPKQLWRILCSNDPTAIFRRGIGTSYAAPAVARVASAVKSENPSVRSSALTRALVLQSARPIRADRAKLPPGSPADVARHQRNLTGHGAPRLREAIGSSADRVIFVAEGTLPVDFVVLYSVPLPASYFQSGGRRRLTLGLSFDPLTRYKRLDYLASRLYPYLFHGADADKIAAALVHADDPTLQSGPLKALKAYRLELNPSPAASSDSANIFGIWERATRMDPVRGDSAILAIRSSRRWAPESTEDRFGVALTVEHDGVDIDLHAELAARVELLVEISLTG